MHLPISNFLFAVGRLNIYFFGVGLVLIVMMVLFLFWKELKTTALNEEQSLDTLFVNFFLAIVIGRIVYLAFNPKILDGNYLRIVLLYLFPGINELSFWLAFILLWFIYARQKKISFLQIAKVIWLPLILARLLLAILNLLLNWQLLLVGPIVLYLGLYLLMRFVFLERLLKQKISESEYFIFNGLSFSIAQFLTGFFLKNQIYLFSLRFISLEQGGYLLILLLISAIWLYKKSSRKKITKTINS